MQHFELSEKHRKLLGYSLIFMLVARVVASLFIPLTDTTEARYGEIARKMLELGDWITPQHDYGVPFWAKPPLSFWLSALSMKLFGINEFAARLPSLLFGIGMLALVWIWIAPRRGRDFALVVCAVLASMVLFFIAGGAVMTDSSLAFCTTLAMVSFWQALHTTQRRWGYLFFVALGVGLLAKGPLVGVLAALAIVPWLTLRGAWRTAWQRLPWFAGIALMLAIAAPWYLLAEHKTPGFLAYFILGEHFGRFLNAGWTGDKYGHAHSEALGTIWLYWLASASPWSLMLLAGAWRQRGRWRALMHDDSGFMSYLLLWSFTSIAFFTFAHNIIWPYALPALPAFAILAVELWSRSRATEPAIAAPRAAWPRLAATLATPLALLIMTVIYADDQQVLLKSSQRDTARYYLRHRPTADSKLYYYHRRYYSGEFYSRGKAQVVDADDLDALAHDRTADFLVIQTEDLAQLSPEQRALFLPRKTFEQFVVLEKLPKPMLGDTAQPCDGVALRDGHCARGSAATD